jgi:hypothetical protein
LPQIVSARFSALLALGFSLFIFVILPTGCSRAPAPPPYPHEAVATVLMELEIFLLQDPYRRPPGRDLDGNNIFRVTLKRLEALEELSSPEMVDVIAFARAQCLERLGQWREAAQLFDRAAVAETTLAEAARQCAFQAARLAEIAEAGHGKGLTGLELMERALREYIDQAPPFPYESLARLERECVQRLMVRRLLAGRFTLGDLRPAAEVADRLVEQNGESWRRCEDLLLQGELFETLARDVTDAHPPHTRRFRLGTPWTQYVARARRAYLEVARADGDPAKPEGLARLRALDAYALRIQKQAR